MKVGQKLVLFVIVSAVVVGGIQKPVASAASPNIKKEKVVLGGLFSLTGGWSSLGQSSKAALEIAVDDANEYLARADVQFRLDFRIEDTQLLPNLALEKLQSLADQKIRIVLGPQSSAEVAVLKTFADTNDLLLISQSSTAGSLAIAGDNVFRFTPDDDLEGEAISALMHADGIRAIVPLWRDDPGNGGLHDAVARHFPALGGTVLTGVKYSQDTQDFSSAVADVLTQVTTAQAQYGKAAVAVYLAGFDEVASIFNLAAANTTLSSSRWYGSDGVALSVALLNDPVAAAFANQVGYPNPLFGLDEAARLKWEPIAAQIKAKTGSEPESFALGVYDAVWVVARTLASHRGNVRFDLFKQEFPAEAADFFGTTGWTILNEAGDRQFGNFDFWAIRDVDGARQWQRVGHYNTASGELVREEQ